MKATYKTTAPHRLFATILALLIALSLAVPAQAKDAELEPDAFTSTTASAVSSTAPADADSTVAAAEESNVSRNSADDSDPRTESRSSESLTLGGFIHWLYSLPIFGR